MRQTKLWKVTDPAADRDAIREAAEILRRGGLVAIPTETVYGLAANALDGTAVAQIFRAKGRPQDNPLIVHIADIAMLEELAASVPPAARALAKRFWPGPLTMILPKGARIPEEVSAGLPSVAIRFPAHPVAQAIIREAGVPLAAPSANLSGRPSTTTAQHCIDDLTGRVDGIVDGGACSVGIESTVITLVGETPRLLRPGAVTHEQLEAVLGRVEIDDAVLDRLAEDAVAASPGMKYKHYAPRARVVIVDADDRGYIEYANAHAAEGVYALCFEEDIPLLRLPAVSYGSRSDQSAQARRLFDALRALDETEATLVLARCPQRDNMGLAICNRLLRSAGFEVIRP